MIEIKGAIFDLDGTLFDSMPKWETVAADYLRSLGVTPKPDLRETLRPLSLEQVGAHFRREYGITASVQEFMGAIDGMLEEFYFNTVRLKDGVMEMLEALKSSGVKMCVATATDRHLVEGGMRLTGIMKYFSHVFTCTEVRAGKDQPDIYLQALRFLGTDIKETLIFEDALYAVKTAKNAGFTVAALYDDAARHQQEDIKALADYYFKSFSEWNESNA